MPTKQEILALEVALDTVLLFGSNKGKKLCDLNQRQLLYYAENLSNDHLATAADIVLRWKQEEEGDLTNKW